MDYRSIFISDIHLGSKGCQAEILNSFLKSNSTEKLYLIGDIVDGWKIQQNKWAWRQAHSNVVRSILGYAKKGTQVYYIVGNHDEFLRPMIPYGISFGRIQILNQYSHRGLDGKLYLVVHGDLFDGITRLAPWISFLGDKAYDILIEFNTTFNRLRHRFGFGYWSLSQFLKQRVKRAVNFILHFERNLVDYCSKRGFDGVICGHIHKAEIKEVNGKIYMNDGDWVESCSALVEHHDGRWEIIYWKEEEHVDPISNSSEHLRFN